jgi:periplasmic divalent cation tolerance protein
MIDSKILITITTMPDIDSAKSLALLLVSNKLCGCVNIIPKLLSVYSWRGDILQQEEVLLQIKSKITNQSLLCNFIEENHPYDICEVLQYEAISNNDYSNWIYDCK